MFYSGLGFTNRNREGQNICISAESDGELCLGLWLVRLSLSRLLIGCLGALSQPCLCLVVAIWLPMTLHCCQLFAKLNCHNLGLGLTVKTPSANQRRSGDGSIQSRPGKQSPCALSWYMNAAWWKAWTLNINRFFGYNSRFVSLPKNLRCKVGLDNDTSYSDVIFYQVLCVAQQIWGAWDIVMHNVMMAAEYFVDIYNSF